MQELKGLGYKVDVLNGRIMDKDGVLEDNQVALWLFFLFNGIFWV